MTIGNLEINFLLPILYLLCIVLLIPVAAKIFKKETTHSKHITLMFTTMYSKYLFATSSIIITRQVFLYD